MIDPNSWHYTLSAVPQTLGALFALIIAVVVYRHQALDSLIKRDLKRIKPYLFVLYKDEGEVHVIENWDSSEILIKLDHAIREKINENDEHLNVGKEDYVRLYKLFEIEIDLYERYFSPDPKRISRFLKQKRDKIRTNTKSKKIINQAFFFLAFITGLVITGSIYYLPQYEAHGASTIFARIKWAGLVNVLLIILGVLLMTYTKKVILIWDYFRCNGRLDD